MKLPFEPLMGRRPYIQHAQKKAEERRQAIEAELNRSEQEQIAFLAAPGVAIVVGCLIWLASNLFYAFIWGLITWAICALIFGVIATPKDPKEGKWVVRTAISSPKGWNIGGTVEFICKRIVDGVVIETITRQ